jgi:hypothetical protein
MLFQEGTDAIGTQYKEHWISVMMRKRPCGEGGEDLAIAEGVTKYI